jgi:prepilin-type processing-associated H-X9-DG protein
MKQLCLAVHNFESSQGYLPPTGTRVPVNNTAPPGGDPGGDQPQTTTTVTYKGHSIFAYLLPYVEQGGAAEQIVLTKSWIAPENLPPPIGTNAYDPYATRIRILECPSAPNRTADYGAIGYLTVVPGVAVFGVTDYGVLDGIGSNFADLAAAESGNPVPSGRTGFLQFATLVNDDLDRKVRMSRAMDGLSNCTLFAEDAGRPTRYEMGTQRIGGLSSSNRSEAAWMDYDTEYYVHGSTLDGGDGSCSINCTNDNEIYSFHSQGAMFGMADGHVVFVQKSITPATMAALISAGGGESISNE